MKNVSILRRVKTAARVSRPVHRRHELPALEWAEDAAGLCPRATAIGSRSLLVENHTGITSFSASQVVLDSRSGPLCVTGSDLSLGCVRSGALVVRGEIRRVELPCRGGDAPNEG